MRYLRRIAKCRKQNQNSAKCSDCYDRFTCLTVGEIRFNSQKGTGYIFEVPNDERGQEFIKLCKEYLNNESFVMKKCGRHSERCEVYGYSREDVKIGDAEWFAVYFYKKRRWS